MQSKKVLTRREAIPLIGLILAGCGGGGGGSAPTQTVTPPVELPPVVPPATQHTFALSIEGGSPQTVAMAVANPTILEIIYAVIGRDSVILNHTRPSMGVFIEGINGQVGRMADGGRHWIIGLNGRPLPDDQGLAADRTRVRPGDRIALTLEFNH